MSSPHTAPASDTPVNPAASVHEAPTVTFASFGLHADIQRAIAESGYTHPTPIQAAAIPVAMTGKDIMGAAQTGTGKTAGFSLPILQQLMVHANTSASPARHPVRALILTPTRELADQVAANVQQYGKHTPLRSTVVFGGMDMHPQIAALRKGVEIVIATPGRLLDHVQQKTVNLSQVQILVLDEADRMLDMGFLPDLQRIINLLPKQRQNLMFSATFSNEIQKLAKSFMVSPQLIEVARRNATSENITQRVYKVDSVDDKRAAVAHLIRQENMTQVIVFSNTKIGAGRLARQLEKDGIASSAIHGDKTQTDRMKALDAFKAGEITALVATDVAARGIDIADLPHVINFDLPHSPEDYVHRIGRTGRAGAKGVALALLAPGEERYLADIEKLTKQTLERATLEGFNARSGTERAPADRKERAERGERTERSSRPERADAARAERTEPRRERSPRREKANDKPLNFDAEYERLRSRIEGPRAKDDLFSRPYQEKQDNPSSNDHAHGGQGVAARSGAQRSKKPVAALLGGGRR